MTECGRSCVVSEEAERGRLRRCLGCDADDGGDEVSCVCLQGTVEDRACHWLAVCEVETRRCLLKALLKDLYVMTMRQGLHTSLSGGAQPPAFLDLFTETSQLTALCKDIILFPQW